MCWPGMSPKDKTYKSIRNQNKIRSGGGDVNSCSPESSFKREPIGQWQLQGLKREPAGQRLSRPLRASHFHPLTRCPCNVCQRSCSLNKYSSAINPHTWWKLDLSGCGLKMQKRAFVTKVCLLPKTHFLSSQTWMNENEFSASPSASPSWRRPPPEKESLELKYKNILWQHCDPLAPQSCKPRWSTD